MMEPADLIEMPRILYYLVVTSSFRSRNLVSRVGHQILESTPRCYPVDTDPSRRHGSGRNRCRLRPWQNPKPNRPAATAYYKIEATSSSQVGIKRKGDQSYAKPNRPAAKAYYEIGPLLVAKWVSRGKAARALQAITSYHCRRVCGK